MVEEDARSMLRLIEKWIRASDIRVEHRDALIRLRAMIADDLTAMTQAGARSAQHRRMPRFGSAAKTRNTLCDQHDGAARVLQRVRPVCRGGAAVRRHGREQVR